MAYKLRFVQRFQPNRYSEFMELEKKFIFLEQTVKEFPKGRRYTPYSGKEPGNTLIWECEFPTLEEAKNTVAFLEGDSRHEELYNQQVEYFLESYTEIYKTVEA